MGIRRLSASQEDFDQQLAELTRYEASHDSRITTTVSAILNRVREHGDQALVELTAELDGFTPASAQDLVIDAAQLAQALADLPAADRNALQAAAARVRAFHEHQRAQSWTFTEPDGTRLGQKVTPLDRVGLYVPGGKAAYPSSVLMNAIPARVAGVGHITMVVPTPGGERNPMVLAAAAVAGVDRVVCVGGAQAVAALAFGTELIEPVDKIVGPGNAYVAEAKRQVFGTVGIDMIAGPSEILVLTDGSAPADWIAMDMFSQAEHDEMAQAILLTPDAACIDRVAEAIERLLPGMPRAAVIEQSLRDRGALIEVRDMAQACDIANRIAPEHLEIMADDAARWADSITHAGAIFIGPYSSESLGDYCAGPNHVLPTLRTARFSSPLGVYDFQKRASLIQVSRQGAQHLGAIAATLADREGLHAHAESARLRLDDRNAQANAEPTRDVDDVVRYAVAAGVRDMGGYHVAEANGLIKLDSMENPYTLPDNLRRQLADRLAALNINRYPVPSYRTLKDKLAEVYNIPANAQVVVGNGSDELILMLSLAVAGSGRPIMAPVPTFALYEMSGRLAGGEFVGVALDEKFMLDADAMLAAIDAHQPALVYLAYPNNPTGGCFDDAQIERIIRRAPGLVVLDEAYFPFAGRSWMGRLADFANLVVMRTVSKIGLAGIRIGYLAADPAIAGQLEKVRPPYNISVLDEATAIFALEHIDALDAQAAQIRAGRDAQRDALAALPGVTVFDSQTNFLLVRVPDATRVSEGLVRHGVLVRNVSGMHPALANCLRVTLSTPQENAALLDAMRAVLAELD